ncbi:MAG: hypothetical protein AAFV53_04270 [Myxococcota bacterium]
MTASERLDARLTALGHPPTTTYPDLHAFGYEANMEDYRGDWALFTPLTRRGWCIHFDAEGQFFEPNEHAQLIRAFLTLAGVQALPTVRDTWIKNVGWIMEIEDGPRRVSLHVPETGLDFPSDYCELWLVKALVEEWLSGSHVLIDPNTDDQTAFCCMMPRPIFEALCAEGFIDPDPEEPSPVNPDRMALHVSWVAEEYVERIVRLSAEDADAMLADAPRDWLNI